MQKVEPAAHVELVMLLHSGYVSRISALADSAAARRPSSDTRLSGSMMAAQKAWLVPAPGGARGSKSA